MPAEKHFAFFAIFSAFSACPIECEAKSKGVDSGDQEFLAKFKKLLNLDFPLLTGKRRTVKRILRKYGNIRRIPTLIIIDLNGNIAHRINGFKGKEELKKILVPLLVK